MSDTTILAPGQAPQNQSAASQYWNRRIKTNTVSLILAVIGIVLATLLTIEEFTPAPILPCSAKGMGCEGTLHSQYGHLGPIPTALFGLGFYLLAAFFFLKRRPLIARHTRQEISSTDASRLHAIDKTFWFLSLTGVLISWWLQYIAVFVIVSFCPYCFTSALIVTTLCAIAYHDHVLAGKAMGGEQKMLIGISLFVLVALGFFYIPEISDMLISAQDTKPKAVSLNLRDLLLRPNLHMLGSPNAKYKVVEFADYGCPHCKEASEKIPGLAKKYPDVAFIFRNFPLGFNLPMGLRFPNSLTESEAAEAAGMQGQFWQMHDDLYEAQKEMDTSKLPSDAFENFAKQLNLNMREFATDMNSAAVEKAISADVADGTAAKVDMTPTFFLITPDHITKFVGIDELEAVLAHRNNSSWK